MISRSTVLIVGEFRFPDQDAAAARVLGVGKALRAAGYRVAFAGWESGPRPEDIGSDDISRFDGFEYYSQMEFRVEPLPPLRRLFRYLLAGRKALDWIAKFGLKKGDRIIAYHGRSIFLFRLAWLCRRLGVELVFDCTEWYAPENLIGGRWGLAAAEDAIRMYFVYRWIGRGIVISHYLERFYSARGVEVLRVPPLIDTDDKKWLLVDSSQSGKLNVDVSLVYAGVPGRKDLLAAVIEGMIRLRDRGISSHLELVGPTRDDLLAIDPRIERWLELLGEVIVIRGRVQQGEVPRLLQRSDFSVLVRPVTRVSAAGFPTKLVESLAAGVPVIGNAVGDFTNYVTDGVHGLISATDDVDEIERTLVRAASLLPAERRSFSVAARELALSSFDYRVYAGSLSAHIFPNRPSVERSFRGAGE